VNSRVALITGATDGIGKATASRLLAQGWEVVVVGRNATRCASTVSELAAAVPGARVSALVGDLTVMAEVARIGREFCASHARLDLLLLNANAITQTHTRTREGFEANLAVGFLGRALLAWELAAALERTPASQVLSVVGLNLERLDFEDPSSARKFSSMKALGRWQWSIQLFTREWNRCSPVPMNTYMPGLVRTKILASEPQPMRLIVKLANLLMGVPVGKSGEELAFVVDDVVKHGRRDGYYARKRFKGQRDLKEQPGDGPRLWDLTASMLASWATSQPAHAGPATARAES
jgi:NAD(P)-dependent dehydrogenase (short-subunit alcohol dehydrogenase family)